MYTFTPLLKDSRGGFSIIEIVIATAVIVGTVTFIATSLQFHVATATKTANKTVAAALLEEGAEALQLMRDTSWEDNIDILSEGTKYYLFWNGMEYTATTTPSTVQDHFYRTIVFSRIYRNSQDSISPSGAGSIDPNTQHVTMKIHHMSTTTTPLVQAEMLLHNSYEN